MNKNDSGGYMSKEEMAIEHELKVEMHPYWCAGCGCPITQHESDSLIHHGRYADPSDHMVDVAYECLVCGNIFDTFNEAWNCHCPKEIRK